MIDLGKAPLHAEGITVFCDNADPKRFHYLPDAPRLRMRDDGRPELSLLKYRLDPALHHALGAGLLSFTVDLGVDDDVLDRLSSRIARQLSLQGKPLLGPIVPDSGRCDLVVIDAASPDAANAKDAPSVSPPAPGAGFGLVEQILGGVTPSLFGDEAATFMVVLSAEGVALAEGALRGGGLPAGVVYALDVLGIRPALRAEISARWQDVYDYYQNRLHGGKLLLAVDIGKTVAELVHSELLTIHIDELVPADERDAAYDQAVDRAQSYVLDQFFKPTLGQAPPPADTGDGPLQTIGNTIKDLAGFFSLTYSLQHVDRNELKTMTYRLSVAQAERMTLSPQGTLSLLLKPKGDGPPVDVASLVTIVEPAPSEQMDFDVGCSEDLDAEDIDHLELTMTYGDRSETLLFDAKTPRRTITFWHEDALGLAVHYRYEVHFKAGTAGTGDVIASPDASTEDRVIRVSPRSLFQRVAIAVVAAGVPFDRYPTVIVDLTATDSKDGWSNTQTILLDAAHPEGSWVLRATLGATVVLQRKVRYVDTHGVETKIDWDTIETGTLIVGDPLPDILDVQVVGSARFGTEVARLIVELRLAAHPDLVTTKVLTAAQPFATWSIALPDKANRSYEYRVTVHTVRDEVRQGEWLPGTDGTLVVGEGIARLRQVQLMFVGRTFRDLALLGVKVRFTFDDDAANLHAEDEMLVEDSAKTVTWSYPVADPTRQQYSYGITLIHADGRVEAKDPVMTSDLLIIYPLT